MCIQLVMITDVYSTCYDYRCVFNLLWCMSLYHILI